MPRHPPEPRRAQLPLILRLRLEHLPLHLGRRFDQDPRGEQRRPKNLRDVVAVGPLCGVEGGGGQRGAVEERVETVVDGVEEADDDRGGGGELVFGGNEDPEDLFEGGPDGEGEDEGAGGGEAEGGDGGGV